MKQAERIELLRKARNLLHNNTLLPSNIVIAHDCIDMVLDDIVAENFENRNKAIKSLKLYNVVIHYGSCIIAAEDELEVLCIIAKNSQLRYEFSDRSTGKIQKAQEILEFVREIEGYTLQGKPSIISLFQE